MAQTKTAPAGSSTRGAGNDKRRALDAVMAQIEKQHGKGSVMRLGDEDRPPIQVIPTGAIALDVALGVPQFVLAFWTAPRGDDDGLWLLWIPLLWVFAVFLVVPVWLGGRLRERAGGS